MVSTLDLDRDDTVDVGSAREARNRGQPCGKQRSRHSLTICSLHSFGTEEKGDSFDPPNAQKFKIWVFFHIFVVKYSKLS